MAKTSWKESGEKTNSPQEVCMVLRVRRINL
jgi:hypothetical protein